MNSLLNIIQSKAFFTVTTNTVKNASTIESKAIELSTISILS